VITPYAAQQREINQILVNKRRDTENKIMVSTVDSYQGQERDVILVSMVRANIWGKVGFMCDQRRINVALTRAKYLLITTGHHQTLANNSIWKQYIEHLRDELNCYHMLTNNTSPF
jgi:ATP-dependent RNA/DNA helicase IGHMBP2